MMSDALAHRGPDGRDICTARGVGLGHCMLHTTPESCHEHLPLSRHNDALIITSDARIDNREDLIQRLGCSGPPELITDSALILSAYERWGKTCVNHLLGDFAFAIWDAENEQLFCARDHMGVKPFYYYYSDDTLCFASEMKALLCLPEVPRQINERSLAFQLVGFDPDHAITPYVHIHRLPAAHTMTASPQGVQVHSYWSLDPRREISYETDEEYAAAFRSIFYEAVRCRMRSAFPVGSELSGGLDSSSIVCVARDISRKRRSNSPLHDPLHTFSAVFDEAAVCDERTYINTVLSGDLQPHYIHPEQISPLHEIEHRIRHCEDPSLSPTSYTYWTLYQAARKAGVRVMLSGEWADVVVSYGNGALHDFAMQGRWSLLWREINEMSKVFHERRRGIIWRELIQPFIPDKIRIRQAPIHHQLTWLNKDFTSRSGLNDYFSEYLEEYIKPTTAREHHLFNISAQPIERGLEAMDKNAAAHSIEARYPFLDRRIVEFCLALPPDQRIRDGYTRAIERLALSEYLPREIRLRGSKPSANPYIVNGLRTYEASRLKDLLLSKTSEFECFIDPDFIEEVYEECMAGNARHMIQLWRTVVLAFWLQAERERR